MNTCKITVVKVYITLGAGHIHKKGLFWLCLRPAWVTPSRSLTQCFTPKCPGLTLATLSTPRSVSTWLSTKPSSALPRAQTLTASWGHSSKLIRRMTAFWSGAIFKPGRIWDHCYRKFLHHLQIGHRVFVLKEHFQLF
jgi:hypothetical protein